MEVLIVDDNEDFASNLAELAELEGLQATVAHNGDGALAACVDHDFLVAVVDQRLPDGQGTDLIPRLTQACPDVVTVVVTAYASLDHTVAALNQGAFAFVSKAADPEEILSSLRRAVETSRLRRDNRRLRSTQAAILQAIPDFLLLVDGDLRVVSVSQEDRHFCVMEPAEVAGKALQEILSPVAFERFDWQAMLQPGSPRDRTLAVPDASGKMRSCEIRAVCVPSSPDGLTLIRIVELTERIELERRLAHSETLATLGRLASTIAHELRNPLAGIRALTQVVQSHLPGDGPDQENVAEILGLTDRMQATLSDLLKFSRRTPSDDEDVDLRSLLQDAVQEAQRWPDAQVRTIHLEIAADCRSVITGQADRLLAAINNLVENGLQAVPAGGRVEIKVWSRDDHCYIEIDDSGKGIPPEQYQLIFEPFYTNKTRGTGLGLSIVRQTVEAHGGCIEVQGSGPLGGAHFEVRLPSR